MALVDYESDCWSSDEEDYDEEMKEVNVYIMENKKKIYVDIDDVAYEPIVENFVEIGRKWGNVFVPKEIDNDVIKMYRLIWKNVPVNNDFRKSWTLMKNVIIQYFNLQKIKLEQIE